MQKKKQKNKYRKIHTVILLINTDRCIPQKSPGLQGTYVAGVQMYGGIQTYGRVYRTMQHTYEWGIQMYGGPTDILQHTDVWGVQAYGGVWMYMPANYTRTNM